VRHAALIKEVADMIGACKPLNGSGMVRTLVPWMKSQPELKGKLDYSLLPTDRLEAFKISLGEFILNIDPKPVIPPMPKV
jgi:hypothetical protein